MPRIMNIQSIILVKDRCHKLGGRGGGESSAKPQYLRH